MKSLKNIISLTILSFSAGAFAGISDSQYQTIDVQNANALLPKATSMIAKTPVIEFFWYGCLHCYKFEPLVDKFLQKNGTKIVFKRYPAAPMKRWESGARLFFTLQDLGLEEKLHKKVFATIQDQHINIMDDAEARKAFFKKEGVDPNKVEAIFSSFSMSAKIQQAKKYAQTYKISGTPSFIVNNHYITDPTLAGGYDETFDVLQNLLTKK
jgi:protein dithiol oxidoreductase (disulfide-forming)